MASYPTRWMTYKKRVEEDIVSRFHSHEDLFSEEYLYQLSNEAKQLESICFKLITVYIAITLFLIVGLASPDASISVFGVSTKSVPGLKEGLLALMTTTGLGIIVINSSKESILQVIDTLVGLMYKKETRDFARLRFHSGLYVKIFLSKNYERYIFPRRVTTLFFIAICTLAVIIVILALIFSFLLGIALLWDVYRNPTLGTWSFAILAYAFLTWLLGGLWTIYLNVPLPYSDKSSVLRKT